MAGSDEIETTDVIICGCGPTGALLSALLGRAAVKNVVLEREKDIVTDPRGIALDEDGVRLLQEIGIYDRVHGEIGESIEEVFFTSGKQGLLTPPFMRMVFDTFEGGTGHVGGICHRQPIMEKYLREAARRSPHSELRLGSTVGAIEEDADWVRAKYVTDDGQERWIRGKFLVGADGKTGFTRKRYLEPKGVVLESISGYEYQETWVALNWQMDLPTPRSHPDFPLWKLGYSPQDVYDAFFPRGFRFIGNPDRPSVCGTFGPRAERLWRFEFVVDTHKGEDPQAMARPENADEIIYPYLTHPGSRYGIPGSIQFPRDCVRVLRSRPFSFSARSCNKWSVGRVLLCGDSAHVMPPFGGQGIASGFRDASGIAWRLKLACRPTFEGHYESLFNSWCLERKQQLDRSIAQTVRNGNLTTARDPWKIFFRDWLLWFMQLIPPVRHQMELGPRAAGMIRYKWTEGMAFLPGFAGGRSLPQVYCRRVSGPPDRGTSEVMFTDDALYSPPSDSLLRLLVLAGSVDEADRLRTRLDLLDLSIVSNGEVRAEEALFLVLSSATGCSTPRKRVYRIASADEFAASSLCPTKPFPIGYDPHRVSSEVGGRRFILARADKFIFAACHTESELVTACQSIVTTLFGQPGQTPLPRSKM